MDAGGDCALAAPAMPALTPRSIKTLELEWPAVEGATCYRLLEDATGASDFTRVSGEFDGTSYRHVVPLHLRAGARYAVEACDSVCSGPPSRAVTVSGSLAEAVGYVKASNPDVFTSFGLTLAISADGSTLAVGAELENRSARGIDGDQRRGLATDAGAVYVFARNDAGDWSQQAYVKASNTDEYDHFGKSVALSADGSTLAVGASNEDGGGTGVGADDEDDSANSAGAVFVFTREAGTWSQQAYVKASNTDASDFFGTSVALSADGDTLAVGAAFESSGATGVDGNQADDSTFGAGAVYVFARASGVWSQQAYLKASNADGNDFFGWALALSADGTTLAVGARGEDGSATGVDGDQADDSATDAGAVYVFARGFGRWQAQAYVKASSVGSYDGFGTTVALSADGDTLAVGSHLEDGAGAGLDGDDADDSAVDAGAVYLFTRESGSWSQREYFKASNTGAGDWFGISVAISSAGDVLAVGASREDGAATGVGGDETDDAAPDAGAVYVFIRDVEGWRQRAYVKASNTGANDLFGGWVALSADAHTLAVGAGDEDSLAMGVDGDQTDERAPDSGAVYLY